MASRSKKTSEHIPFTQFWCNLSRQLQKQTKTHPKSTKASKSKYCQSALIKPYNEQAVTNHRRSSIGHAQKKLQQDFLYSDKIELPLQFKHKQNRFANKSLVHEQGYEQQNSMNEINGNYLNNCLMKQRSYISSGTNKQKNNVSQKILKVFQCNVIPFLVDKFVEIEQKMNKKIKKLQQVVDEQKQQICILKKNQKAYNQALDLMKSYLQDQANKDYLRQKEIIQKQANKKECRCKVLVQVGNSPIKFVENLDKNNQQNFSNQINKQINDQNQENIQCFSKLLQQLTITIQQSEIRTAQKINMLQKQVKRICEKQKIGQQKIQQQFAEKILELISTYNDNFVDLDKRISNIQQILHQNKQKPLKYLGRALTVPDKQKTYRYN